MIGWMMGTGLVKVNARGNLGPMTITLEMRPADEPSTWAAFCAASPSHSIALDGYVAEGPQFEAAGPRANFNHHEMVDRLATRATCAQVQVAIRQGLFQAFRDRTGARAVVFANDCDQDVCTSWFLLRHHYRAEPTMNALLNRLVAMEDMLDTTAGAYPFPPDLPVLGELAWVFEPYTQCRLSGGLDTRDAARFRSVVEDVEGRIGRHLSGAGGSVPLDTSFTRLRSESGWTMVREDGAQARTGMFADGIHAFVSARERRDGRFTYVVGRMSRFVPFDVPAILTALNDAEGCPAAGDRWGGGDTVGGSPRVAGSALGPDEVARVVQAASGGAD